MIIAKFKLPLKYSCFYFALMSLEIVILFMVVIGIIFHWKFGYIHGTPFGLTKILTIQDVSGLSVNNPNSIVSFGGFMRFLF
jgi:hypothetical protein